jgi:hypothetical protein
LPDSSASGGFTTGEHAFGAGFVGTTTNGYRDDTGYGQQKAYLAHMTQTNGWAVKNQLTATLLNQETGSYVRGFEAYKDDELRRSNPNPEAFRDAWSMRASSEWVKDQWTLKPYIRRSQMTFLQHFLPGQPLEENEQTSGGLIVNYDIDAGALQASVGGQLELMTGALREFQAGPTTGSAFLVATRPSGLHYDYDVDSELIAGFYDLQFSLTTACEFCTACGWSICATTTRINTLSATPRTMAAPAGLADVCIPAQPAETTHSPMSVHD